MQSDFFIFQYICMLYLIPLWQLNCNNKNISFGPWPGTEQAAVA